MIPEEHCVPGAPETLGTLKPAIHVAIRVIYPVKCLAEEARRQAMRCGQEIQTLRARAIVRVMNARQSL